MVTFFSKSLFAFLNKCLFKLDPDAYLILQPHFNKIICVEIEKKFSLYFQVMEKGVLPIAPHPQPDVRLTGALSAFITPLFNQKNVTGIHLNGDLSLAHSLFELWHSFNPDLEGYAASWIGGTLAYGLSQNLKKGYAWLNNITKVRCQDTLDYLQAEKRFLPLMEEITYFNEEIDNLRLAVDRLEAKLALLQTQLIEKEKGNHHEMD